MSCSIVSDLTISAIVSAMLDTMSDSMIGEMLGNEMACAGLSREECESKVGQLLLGINYKAVNAHYGEEMPVRMFKMKEKADGKPFTLGEQYGCIRYYDFQTCELPEYEDSLVAGILEAVKEELVQKMLEKLGEKYSWGL